MNITAARPPAAGTGVLIGYARAAAAGQDLDARVLALREAGCTHVFTDTPSDDKAGQPGLTACLDALRAGDTLMVESLGQLGRSLRDLIRAVGEVRRRGAGFTALREDLDTTAPDGDAVFRVFAGLEDFGRDVIAAGTRQGRAAARTRGRRPGRPPALTAEQIRQARELLARPENTVSSVARELGVSRSTIYKHIQDVIHPDVPAPELAGHGHPRGSAHLTKHKARPGRGALVIDDLSDLHGPVSGTVELPIWLFWYPDRAFNLDEPGILPWMYQIVLREAGRPEDLASYLNAGLLTRLWPELHLPKGVRQAWEERHPSLRAKVSS
jgi:DNA invertase Pin-like site-specific DNA recombinase